MPKKTGVLPPPDSEAADVEPAATKPSSKQRAKQQLQEQEQHAKVLAEKFAILNGYNAEEMRRTFNVDELKTLIGWTETEGEDYHVKDPVTGKKILLLNNKGNRFLSEGQAMDVAQDVLNKDWSYNAEPILIDTDWNVVSGQRRIVGAIFAESIRTGPFSAHWAGLWDGPITLDAAIIYGVDPSVKTKRTIDNTRPRSVFDALYTEPALAKYTKNQRKAICRIFDNAIRTVWLRTGQANNVHHARKTVSELMSFKDRHPGILKAVLFIFDEDGEDADTGEKRKISGPGRWINAGTAAGLLYLMATSASDPGPYYRAKQPSEKQLNKSLWDRAETFWTVLASGGKDDPFVKAAGKVRRPGGDENDRYGGYILKEGSTRERAALISKLWLCFAAKEEPTAKDLKLEYDVSASAGIRLVSDPSVGGIDKGFQPPKPDSEDKAMATLKSMTPVPAGEEAPSAAVTKTASAPAGLTQEQLDLAKQIRQENCQSQGLTDTGNLD